MSVKFECNKNTFSLVMMPLKVNFTQQDLCREVYVAHLREISQYFWHFIATLPTAHVNDDITVRILGQGLWDHGFTTPKGSWDSRRSSLDTPIQQTI